MQFCMTAELEYGQIDVTLSDINIIQKRKKHSLADYNYTDPSF